MRETLAETQTLQYSSGLPPEGQRSGAGPPSHLPEHPSHLHVLSYIPPALEAMPRTVLNSRGFMPQLC